MISASLIKAQARYNSPQATWTPLWLALLVQRGLDDAGTILKERLKDFPDDIQTNELIYRISSPTEKARFCLQMNSLPAEKNGDLDWLYLKSLCLEGPERLTELQRLHSQDVEHPRVNRALGWEKFHADQLKEALFYFQSSFESDPYPIMPELETVARLMRYFGASPLTIVQQIGPWAPFISHLAARDLAFDPKLTLETPPLMTKEDLAYAYLEQGLFEEAMALADDGELAARLIRLQAGAPGASKDMTTQALELPNDRGLTSETVWTMIGLAVSEGIDVSPYLPMAAGSHVNAAEAAEAIQAGDGDELWSLLEGQDPWFQGQACLAGHLALGADAPPKCLQRAAGFLFPGERPVLAETPRTKTSDEISLETNTETGDETRPETNSETSDETNTETSDETNSETSDETNSETGDETNSETSPEASDDANSETNSEASDDANVREN
jgi:tetratricopeptide (TPR) repeat protein